METDSQTLRRRVRFRSEVADSDGDGVPDADEFDLDLIRTVQFGWRRLSGRLEIAEGTDPADADSQFTPGFYCTTQTRQL